MRILRTFLVALWFLSFGLLPIWMMWAWLWWEGRNASDDYWLAAPWMIVAVTPLCAVSLTIAGLTWLVYMRVSGRRWRKLMYAVPVCVLLTAGAAYAVQVRWEAWQAERAAREAARLAVEQSEFAADSAQGTIRVGSGATVIKNQDGIPERFVISVRSPGDGPGTLLAIVDVTRAAGEAEYHIACLIPPEEYRRLDPHAEPCQSDAALPTRP